MSGPQASGRLIGSQVLEDALVTELLTARLVGVLATSDSAGFVHAVPMWFASHDGFVWLATGSRSRKVENLERDARATLVVHDSRPGFEVCGASIAGRVEILRADAACGHVDLVHRRYLSEAAERHPLVREFLESDDVALRLEPEFALTWDERGSEANHVLRALGAALPLVPTEPRG